MAMAERRGCPCRLAFVRLDQGVPRRAALTPAAQAACEKTDAKIAGAAAIACCLLSALARACRRACFANACASARHALAGQHFVIVRKHISTLLTTH